MTDEDKTFDEMISDSIAEASVAVCRSMARFCLRLAQTANCPETMRVTLIMTSNRWHDAAVTKLDAERAASQEEAAKDT